MSMCPDSWAVMMLLVDIQKSVALYSMYITRSTNNAIISYLGDNVESIYHI